MDLHKSAEYTAGTSHTCPVLVTVRGSLCVQVTFESDPRQQFLNLLGYDREELEQKVCRTSLWTYPPYMQLHAAQICVHLCSLPSILPNS